MGWYTDGPGKLSYKYGNVVAVARGSRVGSFTMVPRINAVDREGDFFEEHAFVGPLQKVIEERDLAWDHIVFDEEDTFGESIRLQTETDPWDVLHAIAAVVRDHSASILAVLGEVARIGISGEFAWVVERADWPALAAWLNEPFDSAPITEEALRRGQLDEFDWYAPPEELNAAFECFEVDDDARLLAAHAWAHALIAGEDVLKVYQPEDDYDLPVWPPASPESPAENPPAIVFFRVSEVPLLDKLAQAFDVPNSVREGVFYCYPIARDVDMPPEDDIPEEHIVLGMRFCEYLAGQIFAIMPRFREVIPMPEDEYELNIGWHPNASLEAVVEAAKACDLTPWELTDLLAPAIPEDATVEDRLAALEQLTEDEEQAAFARHVLHGGDAPDAPVAPFIAMMLNVLGTKLELPAATMNRLDSLIGRAPKEE